jgi:serine/threonine protein kinase
MLNCIRAFHTCGFVHRDIKPGNFLIRSSRKCPLALIDYGFSFPYIDPATRRHVKFSTGLGFTGTVRYASLNAHRGLQLSRRDDMISWFYSVVELASGGLPWPGAANLDRTGIIKETLVIDVMCCALPVEFIDIYKYIMKIEFDARPDYAFIAKKITKAIRLGDFVLNQFDWELLPDETIRKVTAVNLDMADNDSDLYHITQIVGERCCGCCG